MERLRVHRQRAEQHVVHFGDRAAQRMVASLPFGKFLKIQPGHRLSSRLRSGPTDRSELGASRALHSCAWPERQEKPRAGAAPRSTPGPAPHDGGPSRPPEFPEIPSTEPAELPNLKAQGESPDIGPDAHGQRGGIICEWTSTG